jgi:predicted alpha/beta hydrolase
MRLKADPPQAIEMMAIALVTLHLIASALFFMEASLSERIAWTVLTIAGFGAAIAVYLTFRRPARAVLCFAVGLPALLFGAGIHASHLIQIGFTPSDFTGVLMLASGLILTLMGGVALVRLIHTWWRRLFLIPPAIAFAFFVIFPVTLGVFATNVARYPCCSETPADRSIAYEDVTFETAEGLTLSAWYIPTQNGAVVITVHGAGKNRATVLDEAEVLVRHGYGLLMVDIEGFGGSEGRANAFGWVGARDVHAAVAYLQSRPDLDPQRIGGLGLSMGGEVLLHAAGESDSLKAVVAEGATGRTAKDFREMDDFSYDTIATAVHLVAGATMQLISGEPAPPPLKQMVQQIAPRRVLLIAASIPEEEELMGMYHDLGGGHFDLWTIPESKHVGAFDLHPEEYEERIIAFFDDALLGDAGTLGLRAR